MDGLHDLLARRDEQIAKLRTIALDYDRVAIRGKAEVMVAERELRALTRDEQAEMAAIEAKVKEGEALEATVRILRIKVKRDLMGVLTPEQRAKQKALWEERRQRHRGPQPHPRPRGNAKGLPEVG